MTFAATIHDLLRDDRLPALGPGEPAREYRGALAALTIEHSFAPAKIVNRDFATACLAGLWLHFDFLDESHQLSQDLDTVEGSYWHGLLHRREPDYWNSKYWFRRVGRHPVFEALHREAVELTRSAGIPGETAFLIEQKVWDPLAFVDLCEAASLGKADEMLCRRIQRREWDLLFEYCYRRAVDK